LLSTVGIRQSNPARVVIIGGISGSAHHRSWVHDCCLPPPSLSLSLSDCGKVDVRFEEQESVSLENLVRLLITITMHTSYWWESQKEGDN
jgi:hypothetical protein